MCRLKKTATFFVSTGKGTASVAEKLRFHQRLGNCAAIHRDERMRVTPTMGVQVTRREFFATTRLADNGHRSLTVCNPQNLFA
jgi:hypothetical protein